MKMSFIHCNKCYKSPLDLLPKAKYYVSACMHILCDRCHRESEVRSECLICKNSPFVARAICKSMPPLIMKLFAPHDKVIGECLSKLDNTIKFRSIHENLVQRHLHDVKEAASNINQKYDQICRENDHLQKEMEILNTNIQHHNTAIHKIGGVCSELIGKIQSMEREAPKYPPPYLQSSMSALKAQQSYIKFDRSGGNLKNDISHNTSAPKAIDNTVKDFCILIAAASEEGLAYRNVKPIIFTLLTAQMFSLKNVLAKSESSLYRNTLASSINNDLLQNQVQTYHAHSNQDDANTYEEYMDKVYGTSAERSAIKNMPKVTPIRNRESLFANNSISLGYMSRSRNLNASRYSAASNNSFTMLNKDSSQYSDLFSFTKEIHRGDDLHY